MRTIGHFIGGKTVAGTSGRFADVFLPSTGEVQARHQLLRPGPRRPPLQTERHPLHVELVQRPLAVARAVALNLCIRGMVVNGFEVLAGHGEAAHARVAHQAQRDVAHQVFDELRMIVGTFGHVLLVAALQHAVKVCRRFLLRDRDEVADAER